MTTKNLFGWLAMTALLVGTGCSTDEVVNDFSQDNAIQFGTYVGRNAVSRATVIEIDELAEEGFGVFAYYTNDEQFNAQTSTPNFMYNQEVKGKATTAGEGDDVTTTYSTTDWEYTPIKYWPNETSDYLSFFAYAPYQGSDDSEKNLTLSTLSTGGVPTVAFTLNQTVKSQEDLLWAAPHMNLVKNQITNGIDIDDKVTFEFQHALSRIGFAAEVMVDKVNSDKTGEKDDDTANTDDKVMLDASTTITINSVKIHGRFTNGTLNLSDGTWTIGVNDKPEQAKTLELNATNTNFATNANVFKSTDQKNKRDLNADDSYIMIVPQDFTDVSNNGSVQIEVNYTVETTDAALTDGKSTIVNNILSDAFTINFEQKKAYKFVLHLGMTSVKVSANVADWDETADDIAVNVPLNIADNDPVAPAP